MSGGNWAWFIRGAAAVFLGFAAVGCAEAFDSVVTPDDAETADSLDGLDDGPDDEDGGGGQPDDGVGDSATEADGGQDDDRSAGDTTALGPGEPVEIVRVIDGDSLEATLADGSPVEIRLEGINAPELNSLSGGRTCVGEASRDTLDVLLAAGPVTVTGNETDRFGRLLATLWVGGVPANGEMVRSGWALAQWSSDDERLIALMIDAAEARAGWWGEECGPANLGPEIGATQANAPGNDRANLDQEWVELVNPTGAIVGLDGWVLRDDTTSNRFLLDGITLDAGATLRVHTGRGASSLDSHYLDESFPVWSNNGETVLLEDPEGRLAAWAFLDGS